LILSCWGEGWSRSWRVTGCEITENLLRLHCVKQMGRADCVVELRRGQLNNDAAASRTQFTAKIATLIEANLTAIQVEQVITQRDDYRHLSGIYTRLILKERHATIAAIAIGQYESQTHIDATLSAGMIWLNELRSRGRRVNQLMIFLPRNCAITIACRLVYIRLQGANIRLYEIDEEQKTILPLAAFDQADLTDKLKRAAQRADWSQDQPASTQAKEFLEEVKQLAPGAIDEH